MLSKCDACQFESQVWHVSTVRNDVLVFVKTKMKKSILECVCFCEEIMEIDLIYRWRQSLQPCTLFVKSVIVPKSLAWAANIKHKIK